MSLRAKLAILFGALAVLPLLAVGVFDYSRSLRAVEALIAAQTAEIAQRAAGETAGRLRLLQANAGLLADNVETAALYRAHRAGRLDEFGQREDARDYFAQLWAAVRGPVTSVSYRTADGAELYRLADETEASRPYPAEGLQYVVTREIRDGSAVLGYASVAAPLDSVLPRSVLASRFGRSGFSLVIDDRGDSILFASPAAIARARRLGQNLREIAPLDFDDDRRTAAAVSSFVVRVGDSTRVGTRVRLAAAPLSIVSVGTLEEFAAPLERIRTGNLATVFAIAVGVSGAFTLLLWRATRSLSALTVAADQVSRGNFHPALPPAGSDEVGRLAGAFSYMLDRVREMMREMERSRRVRAVGEFAAQIAHEIRNPLTSIKLNLQKLDRASRHGSVSPDLERPIAISLGEIQRLDRVVRAVLRLGRRDSDIRTPVSVQRVIADAIDVARPQLEQHGARVTTSLNAHHDQVLGDPALLQAAFVNLLLNAAEAMPGSGTVTVDCANVAANGRGVLRCRVEDDGPGVQAENRDRIFDPFFTTRPNGTGLGLALVQRTVEEHRGSLYLDTPVRGRGAAFVLELPLAEQDVT